MDKIFRYGIPALGVALIALLIGGYYYATAIPAADKENQKVLADRAYLNDNQQKYADCHYTITGNSEFITTRVVNQFYNQGASQKKLTALETQFLAKYTDECTPVIADYEARYSQYTVDRLALAKAQQTELDKLMKKTAVVEKQNGGTFSLYEQYDPRSLQYPTYSDGKMLYTADEFADYLSQNL